MPKISFARFTLIFTLAAAGLPAAPPQSTPPKIDRAKWETFLRYAEGYLPNVKLEIDDPKPSLFPGFFDVFVHLSAGQAKLDRHYYVTADGESIVSGTLWNLDHGPFSETLKLLPKDGFSFGPANAPVNIVLFSDFECPFCAQLAKTLRQNVPSKYGDKVHVVFQDFPLGTIHPWARAAAESAHCLGDQKPAAFWAFHDWIFEHQKDVTAANLRDKTMEVAKQQSLDESKVGACLDAHTPAAQIDKSVALGHLLQVEQTPTFFINGRTENSALPWERLSTLIDFELNRPKEFAAAEGQKCCEVSIPKLEGK
jgi:protein-disulfide isomerase